MGQKDYQITKKKLYKLPKLIKKHPTAQNGRCSSKLHRKI